MDAACVEPPQRADVQREVRAKVPRRGGPMPRQGGRNRAASTFGRENLRQKLGARESRRAAARTCGLCEHPSSIESDVRASYCAMRYGAGAILLMRLMRKRA